MRGQSIRRRIGGMRLRQTVTWCCGGVAAASVVRRDRSLNRVARPLAAPLKDVAT